MRQIHWEHKKGVVISETLPEHAPGKSVIQVYSSLDVPNPSSLPGTGALQILYIDCQILYIDCNYHLFAPCDLVLENCRETFAFYALLQNPRLVHLEPNNRLHESPSDPSSMRKLIKLSNREMLNGTRTSGQRGEVKFRRDCLGKQPKDDLEMLEEEENGDEGQAEKEEESGAGPMMLEAEKFRGDTYAQEEDEPEKDVAGARARKLPRRGAKVQRNGKRVACLLESLQKLEKQKAVLLSPVSPSVFRALVCGMSVICRSNREAQEVLNERAERQGRRQGEGRKAGMEREISLFCPFYKITAHLHLHTYTPYSIHFCPSFH